MVPSQSFSGVTNAPCLAHRRQGIINRRDTSHLDCRAPLTLIVALHQANPLFSRIPSTAWPQYRNIHPKWNSMEKKGVGKLAVERQNIVDVRMTRGPAVSG